MHAKNGTMCLRRIFAICYILTVLRSTEREASLTIRITCINKSGGYHADPHHAIERLGWVEDGTAKTGDNTRLEVYDWIKDQKGSAYVLDSRRNKAYVGTRENAHGTKYLQTYADQVWTDNLLALPECGR
jgi:hypothetical protein